MKNIFKKTSRTLIIVSMLCAMLTAGCAKTESNTDNEEATKPVATQVVTENTTEAITEAVTSAEPKEAITIKTPSDDKNADLGITVDCTDSNYKYLNVTTLKDIEDEYQLTDEAVKEIFNINVYNFELSSNIVKLDEKVKVSIPYEEGTYVVHSKDGVAYDVNAEYIDGKYVFETDELGTFVMRTKAIGRTSPVKTTDFTLEEQTLVDEVTGIQVSGKIPAGAEIQTSIHIIDNTTFYDRWEPPYTVEMDYPEFTDISDYLIEYDYEKKVENIAKIINKKGWAEIEPYAGGNLAVWVGIVKDNEVLDFESDLTITLPFNYRRGLATGGITDEATVVQYDYDKKSFTALELVSAEATPKGMFQFKTKSTGRFFAGGESEINSLINFYNNNQE